MSPAAIPTRDHLDTLLDQLLHLVATGAVVATAVALLGYAIVCTAWPYRVCPRCYGASRLVTRSGRVARRCRRCHGTGLRLRLGRRAWNWFSRYRHARREARLTALDRDRGRWTP